MPDVLIYGEIGWDVNAADVVDQIRNAAPGPLSVRLNTPGGSVFQGLAIATHIRARGEVTTHLDGLAASMGSVIFVSGSRRVMAPGTLLMIHNPSSIAMGESDDLRKEADVLDVIAEEIAAIYADASGGKLDKKRCLEMMDAETWMTAEQAIEYGLCDEISGKAKAFARLTERTMYRNTPKGITMENQGLFDRLVASIGGGKEVVALREELDSTKCQLETAQATIAEAVAKHGEQEAALAGLRSEIETMKSAHSAALAEAVAAAKIEGAQEATAQMLSGNAPPPLPHVEPEEETGTATERWNSLRAQGRFEEAAKVWALHKDKIWKGE